MVWFQSPFLTERKESLPGEASDLAIRLVQAGFVSRIPADDPLVRSEPVWGFFFLLQRCLGKSRAVRPSVSKAKETTGMYNRPLNTFQSKLSNKLVKEGSLEYQASKMHCLDPSSRLKGSPTSWELQVPNIFLKKLEKVLYLPLDSFTASLQTPPWDINSKLFSH